MKSLRDISSAATASPSPETGDADSPSRSDLENLPEPLTSVYDRSLRGVPSRGIPEQGEERFWRLTERLTREQCESLERATRKQAKSPVWHRGRWIRSAVRYGNGGAEPRAPAVLRGLDAEETPWEWYVPRPGEPTRASGSGPVVPAPPLPPVGFAGRAGELLWPPGTLEVRRPFRYSGGLTGSERDPRFCSDHATQLKKGHRYYHQVQLQMFVCDVQYCDFVVWTEDDVIISRVSRDEEMLARALPKAKAFFLENVLLELITRSMDPCSHQVTL